MSQPKYTKYLILIAMFYATASVAADVVAFKFSYFLGFAQSGATILFPLTYVLGDITAEVYGWHIAKQVVWFGLAAEILFTLLIKLNLHLPPAPIGVYQNEYADIFNGLGLFVMAGVISNTVGGLLNVYFISRWKVLTKGRFFWLRSIGSTCISELILIGMTMAIAFLPVLNINSTLSLFVHAYCLEIIYALIFAVPAQLIVNLLKKSEGIDEYDIGVSYNPFRLNQ